MNQFKMYRVFKVYELLQTKPRTIYSISRYLDVSQRTVYRYFNLFTELGFKVHKHEFNKYQIIKNEM